MEYGQAKVKRNYFIHLDMGEDVLECLREFVKKEDIKNGAIVVGYGTLSKARYHVVTTSGLPPVDEFIEMEAPLELANMTGIIANYEVHAHMTVSNGKESWGGHLEPGSKVLYLCDILIVEYDEIDMEFALNPNKNNLKLLTIRE